MQADCVPAEKSGKTPDFESLQRKCFKSNFLLQNNNFIGFACEYYSLYGVRVVCSENALAFFEEENDDAIVFYSIYNDIKELKSLLLNSTSAKKFVVTGKNGAKSTDNSKKEKYGMARELSTKLLPDEIYIGITLN